MVEERFKLSQTHNGQLCLKGINLNNFATFNDQHISFSKSFNSIIGETGSGKSLILDALQLILGSRADRKLIRKGAEYATVEASFECCDPNVSEFFEEIGYPFESDEVVIKRIIYANGKSKTFLNFQICNLQTLQAFAKRFIDVVGQFENQKLLTSTYQLVLLDHYIKNHKTVTQYQSFFSELTRIQTEIEKTKTNHTQQAQRLDYINYQLNEFANLNPSIERETELIQKKDKIVNLEENQSFVNTVEHLFESDRGINSLLSQLEKQIFNSEKFISPNIIEKFNLAKDALNEVNYDINAKGLIEVDEEELNNVIEELDQYQKLKRKFGTDTEGIIKIYEDFLNEKEALENNEINLEKLHLKRDEITKKCTDLAELLHKNRIKAATKLSNELTKLIQALNMKGATINIEITRANELNSYGLSEVDFMAETNPGEGFFKVKEIASGGELSRILLALRQVLSSKDSISIFFFDEIDTGIGGETALKIGNALKEVSFSSQVIAITHLPQIANYSDKLIIVSKDIKDFEGEMRTQSTVLEVTDAQIKSHVERMTPLN